MDFRDQHEIRDIEPLDYYKGYLELMFEFSGFKKQVSFQEFQDSINNCTIKVIENDNKIIGAGSLFILRKSHCNPIGQIEDVMIHSLFRNKGLGKKIIQSLLNESRNNGCYKTVLNSLPHNKQFYLNCNFIESGIQFKHLD